MDRRGLTLMEVIVSALILSITVGGVLYIFSTEKGVVARTGRQMQTMDFARQTMEELKNAVRADTYDTGALQDIGDWTAWEDLSGDFASGGKFAGEGRRYRVQDIDADSAFDSDGDGDAANDTDYKKVEVVVDWSEPAESQ